MSDLYTETLRQVPNLGLGILVFYAYQKLVGKLTDIIASSTAALVASTAAASALKESIDRGMVRAEERHLQLMATIDRMPGRYRGKE